jgi:hypothetical protein
LKLKYIISTGKLATLPILISILFVAFIVWPNLAIPLAGQTQMPSIKTTSPSKGETISSNINQRISNSTLDLQNQQHRYNSENNSTSMNNATIAASQKNSSVLSSPSIFNETKSKNTNANISNTFSGHIQKPSTSKNNYNDNNLKSISVSVESTQNVVNGKGVSTVKAIANDAATGKKLENATIKLRINFTSNGTSKLIVGHNGVAVYSVNLNPGPNHHNDLGFTAFAQASAPGYISTSKTATTSSLTSSISGGTLDRQESILNSSSAQNLTQSILNDVQNKLKHTFRMVF